MTLAHNFETTPYSASGADGPALDVFRPTTASRHCAVLLFHGGGWRSGSKQDVHARAAALADLGFTALAVQYRLLDSAPWPAPLADAIGALRWVRAQAGALDIDPDQVVVQGHSAGAHLALMTGTIVVEERPAAIVAFAGPIGFHLAEAPEDGSPLPGLDDIGRAPSWKLFPNGTPEADLVSASPIRLIDDHFPPTILFHGAADQTVNPRSSLVFHQRLIERGIPSDLHIYAERDHGFDRAPSLLDVVVPAATSFIERTVTHRAERLQEAQAFLLTV